MSKVRAGSARQNAATPHNDNGDDAPPFASGPTATGAASPSPYRSFSRADWAKLRNDMPMTLSEDTVEQLTGILEPVSMIEVEQVYLPLTRLINLHVVAAESLHREVNLFLRKSERQAPFIIGMAGSVAVGKSTMARILQALLARWDDHPNVALVPTDGFLLPNAELERRGLMNKKGFPKSYDARRLVKFLKDIKSGEERVRAPVYSHFSYDILPDRHVTVARPDILIVEGLNVLQPARQPRKFLKKNGQPRQRLPYVSDFFDFTIYLDAETRLLEHWYLERFMKLRQTAFRDPASYFHRYSQLDAEETRARALELWRSINLVNLKEHIEHTKERADLILRKGEDHAIENIMLRKT